MKAIGYFHETGADAAADALARQNQEFLEFCQQRGYEPVGTFMDGALGANGGAPGFRQLVDFLRRPGKGFVLVVMPSWRSLGPDPTDAMVRLFQLEGLGAQVAFMDANGEGDATASLLDTWAKWAANNNIGERVRSAMRKKAVKGEVQGRPPYGYRVGHRRKLELVPEEAAVVRYIFRLYLQEGLGVRLIAKRLNEEKLLTRRGARWSMVTIRDILRNRAYLGTYTRFGVRVPGSHPALVAPDEFRAVQDRLSSRRSTPGQRQVSPYLLSGLAYCGYCQNKLIGVSRRQSWRRRSDSEKREAAYRYYQCESRTNQSVCDYHTRRAQELETAVRDAIATSDGTGNGTTQVVTRAGNEAAMAEEWNQQARAIDKKIALLQKAFHKYLDASARGRLSREKLHAVGVTVGEERLRLEEEMAELERRAARQASAEEHRGDLERAAERLIAHWADLPFPEKRSLVRTVVDRVVVTDGDVRVFLRA